MMATLQGRASPKSTLTLQPKKDCVLSHSVMSNSLRPHRLQTTRLLCPIELSRQEYWSRLPFPSPPKEINITFVTRWATGHRSVPIKINHLRLPAINATGQPYALQSKGKRTRGCYSDDCPRLRRPLQSAPKQIQVTDWNQGYKWLWHVSQHFLTQYWGHLFCLDFLWTLLLTDLYHHGSHL